LTELIPSISQKQRFIARHEEPYMDFSTYIAFLFTMQGKRFEGGQNI